MKKTIRTITAIGIWFVVGLTFVTPLHAQTEESSEEISLKVMSYNIYRGGTMRGQPLESRKRCQEQKKVSGTNNWIWRAEKGVRKQKLDLVPGTFMFTSGFDRLEGYVFYATLYGKSPELISAPIMFNKNPSFLSADLDKIFREIAWKAVVEHPLSGVKDKNKNGIGDHLE